MPWLRCQLGDGLETAYFHVNQTTLTHPMKKSGISVNGFAHYSSGEASDLRLMSVSATIAVDEVTQL